MPGQAQREDDAVALDYEYIDSLTCYGEIGNNVFHRLVESRREVWFGDDGSGLIKSQHIRSLFFTEEQRLRWESMPNRPAREATEPSLDLFAAGCFHGPREELSRLPTGDRELEDYLRARGRVTLNDIHQLCGEALVPSGLREGFVDLAAGLPDAWILDDAADQLGRPGFGVARIERNYREELIFGPHTREVLGYRQVLVAPDVEDGAPVDAVIGWTSYASRQLVDSLPAGIPPVPQPPCAPRGSGRGTVIRPGLMLGTGYFTDLKPHLDQWLADGVITKADHEALQPPT